MSSYFSLLSYLLLLVSSSLDTVSGTSCSRYSSSCGLDEVCCNNECIVGSDCFNHLCTFDDDCSTGESCCSKNCKNSVDCTGYNCFTDSDCGSDVSLTCCDGTCQFDCYVDNSVAVVVGTVCGVLGFIFVVSFIILCVCRRRQTRPGRVITATTVANTRQVPQLHPTYAVSQVPPPYQPGYPYHPPPQFERPQTAASQQYNPEAIRSSEQPPPYSEVAQGSSGRVYSPQTYYGAVPTPSAPPSAQ